jgi:PEGA domain
MRHPRFHLSAAVRAAVLAALAMFVASSDASAQSKASVAILGLEVIDDGTGVDPQSTELARTLTQVLREGTRQDVSPYRLAPNSDKELLEVKLLLGCANEARNCMAQIGRDLGADWLIYGKIEKRDTGYQVTLKLLKVDTTAMERVTTEVIPFADNDEKTIRQRWGRSLYNRLTGIPDQGNLTIQANVDQGRVFVDGQLATTLRRGRARIDGLVEGKHTVAIESGGHARYESTMEIGAGKTEQLDAQLQTLAVGPPGGGEVGGGEVGGGEGKPGGTSRTLFWAAAGVTAVSVVGFTITGLEVREAEDNSEQTAVQLQEIATTNVDWQSSLLDKNPCASSFPADARAISEDANNPDRINAEGLLSALQGHCDKGDQMALLTNVFIGVAVAGGLAAGYFYYSGYMQDDGGDGEVARRHKKNGKKHASESTVQVTPTITPNYFGAGVKIEF